MTAERAIRVGAVLLAASYLARGAYGLHAGLSRDRGARLAATGSYAAALPLLDSGTTGYDAPETAWLAGEVALGLADAAPPEERLSKLELAADRYLDTLLLTSGSGYGLAGLAAVERRLEALDRARRTTDLAALSSGPWAMIGPHGRSAIGLLRRAIELEPNVCKAHDELVTVLLEYGLRDDARAAARAAAHAAPALDFHDDLAARTLPDDVLAAFADGSREALDHAPLVSKERKLFYLGLLDERLGALERAVDDLTRAHAEPGKELQHAETAYHLGRVLARLGRIDAAEPWWDEAARSDVFRGAVAESRARIAEKAGRLEDALTQLAIARARDSRRIDLILWEARLQQDAGHPESAVETLRWGVMVQGADRATRVALVETLIASGDRDAAREALSDFKSSLGEGDDTHALDDRLRSGARPGT